MGQCAPHPTNEAHGIHLADTLGSHFLGVNVMVKIRLQNLALGIPNEQGLTVPLKPSLHGGP